MKSIEELLQNLGRPEVLEFGLVTNRLPSVNIGGKFEPVDDEAPTTDKLLEMLIAMGGSRYIDTLSDRPVHVIHSDSIPAGLAAMVAFDGTRSAAEVATEMREAVEGVATGEVTVASRDVQWNGVAIRKGEWLGLADGEPVAGGRSFDDVDVEVVERLLAEPREVLTLLTGADEPDLVALLERIAAAHPSLEVDVQGGGQPHYPLLLSAE